MNELLRRLLDLPPQASTFAYGVDLLHYAVIGTTMLGAAFVFLLALYFLAMGRRHAPGTPTEPVPTSSATEITIIAGLLSIFITFWVVGATQYNRIMSPPADAIPVYVTAKQWMWKFSYADGRSSIDVLTVPVGRPIKLVMTSRDVIHSFYVPAFRMKHDVVPGRYYAAWFQATTPGTFDIRCAEYCGLSHSGMLGHVRVLDADDYRRWQETATPGESQDLATEGLRVAARRGCLGCHTIDGQPHIGPSFAGLYGADVALQDGHTIVADDGYLTRSMMEPQADVVAGFQPVMPSYRGILEEPEVAALVELIASLQSRPDAPSVALPKVAPVGSAAPAAPARPGASTSPATPAPAATEEPRP
jgi:cytochrome c oxidase subunit 2